MRYSSCVGTGSGSEVTVSSSGPCEISQSVSQSISQPVSQSVHTQTLTYESNLIPFMSAFCVFFSPSFFSSLGIQLLTAIARLIEGSEGMRDEEGSSSSATAGA